MSEKTAKSATSRRLGRPAMFGIGALVVLVLFVGISEWAGWPFLAGPMQSTLTKLLDRQVRFDREPGDSAAAGQAVAASGASSGATAHKAAGVTIHLLGGVSIAANSIEIAAPAWSDGPPLLSSQNAKLKLRYTDIWNAARGKRVVVRSITTERLEMVLERKSDGRTSWQFGKKDKPADDQAARIPLIEELRVADGQLGFDDEQFDSRINAKFWLRDGSEMATKGSRSNADKPASEKSASDKSAAKDKDKAATPAGLHVDAKGRYRSLPFKLVAESGGVLAIVDDSPAESKIQLKVDGTVGHANMHFDGLIRGLTQLAEINGNYALSGRSLAAIGDVIGVTLPTTPEFSLSGVLAKKDDVWNTEIGDAKIGKSRLNAKLRYNAGLEKPLLEGQVGGSKLLLQDLGPAVGTTPQVEIAEPAKGGTTKPAGRVLPAREFDLPSLRAMNADIRIDLEQLDLGTPRLEPLKPMRANLILRDSVLTIKDIDARTAAGSVAGMVSLDAREPVAVWRTDVRWSDIRLEQWLKLARSADLPPYLSGRMDGKAKLEGRGKSTAQILGSMGGSMRTRVRDGTISHLLVEGAGIDLAQALGVWVSGDVSLPMSCALADLKVDNGLMRPEVMVVDTRDSIVWTEGKISLIDESLDLRVVTSPKDFSPLSLRTPVLVKGTLGSPAVSLAPAPLAGKVIAAGLLSLLNPLAALLPLIDLGSGAAKSEGCAALSARATELRQSARKGS